LEVNLISESVKFMFLGMGVVFAFLIIMIFVLKAQGSLLTKFFPQEEKTINVIVHQSENTNVNLEAAKMAAIIAAVQHHKNLKG
jgi:oxaloacetate decarboxylase (Na+ extruding) subunit gamma